MGAPWKELEKHAAAMLHGQRHIRWDEREVAPDVDLPEHSPFVVECKYRKHLPCLLAEGLIQAAHYDQDKIPLLVVKERGQPGALAVLRLADFVRLVHALL